MSKKDYNWWADPNNKKEVEKISWWNHHEYKEDFQFPISVIESDGIWVASCNDETKEIIGDQLSACAQGDTKSDAIRQLFLLLKFQHEYTHDRMLAYQRWVPFRKGQWGQIGGTWLVVFGIHIYLRQGKGMKGGWYIPFTKLNISIHNEWVTYNRWAKKGLLNYSK